MIRTAALALFALGACNSGVDFPDFDPALLEAPADLTDPAVAHHITDNASGHVILNRWPFVLEPWLGSEEVCPVVVEDLDDDGNGRYTYTGGCTDEDGYKWEGRLQVDVMDRDWVYDFDDFGSKRMTTCLDGARVRDQNSVSGSHVENPDGSFDVDLTLIQTLEPCEGQPEMMQIQYAGQRGETGVSGSGTYASSTHGRATVSTTDEVLDRDLCQYEAVSGTTTLNSDGHEVVVTYDGAVDCDPEHTVTWTLDGVDQGEMQGIACSATGSTPGGWMFAGLGVLAFVGRRRLKMSGTVRDSRRA